MDVPAATWEGASESTWRDRWRVPEVILLSRTASTNDVARRRANDGAAAGTVVIADHQTAGRGRFGRLWTTPPRQALLMSVVLRPRRSGDEVLPSTAPIRVGIAAAAAIKTVANVEVGLKWPNDVVIPTLGKIAGILCEGGVSPDGEPWVVAGIGINTAQTAEDFPPELRATATSIRCVTGHIVSRALLAGALLDALRPFRLRDLRPLQPDELEGYARRDTLFDQRITTGGETGVGRGLEPDGALRLRTDSGTRLVRSGSVRPTADTTERATSQS